MLPSFSNASSGPVFAIALLLLISTYSCTSDSLHGDDDGFTPVDPPVDTVTGIVCHPDTIYFELEVLPILKSSCGRRDCHTISKASAGIKLENYQTVMETGGIRPFMPEETRIFRQIIDPDEEERMPPQPYDRLTARQIQIIEDWINQGAHNFRCDSSTIPCNTDSVSFAADIAPVIEDACKGCHNQFVSEGDIELISYENIRTTALNGSLVGTTSGDPGYTRMPFGSIPLSACYIEKIRAWTEAGAPDN